MMQGYDISKTCCGPFSAWYERRDRRIVTIYEYVLYINYYIYTADIEHFLYEVIYIYIYIIISCSNTIVTIVVTSPRLLIFTTLEGEDGFRQTLNEAYLKFEKDQAVGVVTSRECNVAFDPTGRPLTMFVLRRFVRMILIEFVGGVNGVKMVFLFFSGCTVGGLCTHIISRPFIGFDT